MAIAGPGRSGLRSAVERAGGVVGPLQRADALIHLGGPAELPQLPDHVRWVQLPGAGVEAYLASGRLDRDRVWTSAAGAYAATVAEHAVGMLLAGVRGLVTAARLSRWRPDLVESSITGLSGSMVAVVGAGGIGRRAVELLAAFGASTLAVNRSGRTVTGAARTIPADRVGEVWSEVDHVILAAPATEATRRLVDAEVLAQLTPTSWIVNVGRGSLIDSEALLAAVSTGQIAGAALDVTDPEPLPDDHPLWVTPGILITPHAANPAEHEEKAFAARVRENVARFAAGRGLVGIIDLDSGY